VSTRMNALSDDDWEDQDYEHEDQDYEHEDWDEEKLFQAIFVDGVEETIVEQGLEGAEEAEFRATIAEFQEMLADSDTPVDRKPAVDMFEQIGIELPKLPF